MAAAEEIRVDSTGAAVLLDLDRLSTLIKEQKTALKGFLCGQHGFT